MNGTRNRRAPKVERHGFTELERFVPTNKLMSLQPGTTLGPYTVTAKIGEGGMGEKLCSG